MKKLASTALATALALGASACDDGTVDPSDETTFTVTIENVSALYDFTQSGVFNTPVGAAGPGPAFPGDSYEFSFGAAPGSYLTFATMFVQSNDFFYAPDGMGIPLYNADGTRKSGDVTDYLELWDAGSEEDQEPGLGPDQAPRQAGPDTGAADDDTTVRLAADTYNNLPDIGDVIRATLTPINDYEFTLRIENLSDAMTLMTSDGATHPVPLSPGVFVVHTGADPLFTVGADERMEGLAAIAEDGDASALGMNVEGRTGITGPISPGVYASSTLPAVLFSSGSADFGDGLEAIAEDGDPSGLGGVLAGTAGLTDTGVFNTPVGAAGPAPAFPGESYSFEVVGQRGDRLHLATMYVQSNDLFFSPSDQGIDLFNGRNAISGDITAEFRLYDAGTEVNEWPGIGPNQAPRQAGPDTGADENGVVARVNDGFDYPDVGDVIRVTITPNG
ncbi:MAG: spondin domain-containing protein [Gemmatimonadota bacterium]